MRQHAGRLNRGWLLVVGLLLLVAAALGALLASGRTAAVAGEVGLTVPPIDGSDPVLGSIDSSSAVAQVVLAAIGIVLALLGLLWLIAQVPRRNEAGAYRFDTDAASGVTTCEPRVISRAVESAAGELPDVNSAAAVLRGRSGAPELTLQLTVAADADLAGVLDQLVDLVAADLARSLGTPLALLAVSVEVEHARRSVGRVLL